MELFAEDVRHNIDAVSGSEGDLVIRAQDDDGCLYSVIGVSRAGSGPVLLAVRHDIDNCPNEGSARVRNTRNTDRFGMPILKNSSPEALRLLGYRREDY